MQLIEELKKKFHLRDDKDVAALLEKDKSTVSKWRSSGEIPPRVEKEIKRLLSLPVHSPERELTVEELDEISSTLSKAEDSEREADLDDPIATAAIAEVMRKLRKLSPEKQREAALKALGEVEGVTGKNSHVGGETKKNTTSM
jgi:hypothetical protein